MATEERRPRSNREDFAEGFHASALTDKKPSVVSRVLGILFFPVKPLMFAAVLSPPGLQMLPWGDGGAFALVALQCALLVATAEWTRFQVPATVVAAMFVPVYDALDLPPAGIVAGLMVATILRFSKLFTTLRGRDAWLLGAALGLMSVGLGLTFGDEISVISGQAETPGNFLFESIRIGLVVLISTMGYVFIRDVELQKERIKELEIEREQAAQKAAEDERSRIARELHDVVAHHVSVMTIQTEAAASVLPAEATTARNALRQVSDTGRTALGELRRLLGVLRQPGPDESVAATTTLEPQPGLDDLQRLAAQMTDAGLPTTIAVEGDGDALPPGVDLSAYRIVQEALTNALKHCERGTAQVTVRRSEDAVEVEVVNDGAPRRGLRRNRSGAGHGLVGMRERVALFGGELRAGPSERGFTVVARLPVAPATAAEHA